MPTVSIRSAVAATVAFGSLLAQPALAETLTYEAELSGAAQVPPVETAATGTSTVTVDTVAMTMSWTNAYEGLSGDLTAAHYHGPATPEENAGPVVDILAEVDGGSAEITAEQMEQLQGGLWYINLHTAANPDGEIRGQVVAAAE